MAVEGRRAGRTEEEVQRGADAFQREVERAMQNSADEYVGITADRITADRITAVDVHRIVANETGERPRRISDEGHSIQFNNGSSIQFDGSILGTRFITDAHRNEWNHRVEYQQPNKRILDHFDDVMVNYVVPEAYADHVKGAIKIMTNLNVSACSVSHLLVPGHVYVEFTLLKHRIGPESTGQIVNDIQKWHAFLSYMYAVQQGYEPLLWEKDISISDQKIVVKNTYTGTSHQFKQMKAFYESRGYKWETEEVKEDSSLAAAISTNSVFSSFGRTRGGISTIRGHAFLNIYELLQTTEDRAEFATICGMFSEKKHGDMGDFGKFFFELATGKGTDIETHHLIIVKERHGNDLENMFFRRLSPTKKVAFDLSDNNKKQWEKKTRKMMSTNTQKENQFIMNARPLFKGMRFADV